VNIVFVSDHQQYNFGDGKYRLTDLMNRNLLDRFNFSSDLA